METDTQHELAMLSCIVCGGTRCIFDLLWGQWPLLGLGFEILYEWFAVAVDMWGIDHDWNTGYAFLLYQFHDALASLLTVPVVIRVYYYVWPIRELNFVLKYVLLGALWLDVHCGFIIVELYAFKFHMN